MCLRKCRRWPLKLAGNVDGASQAETSQTTQLATTSARGSAKKLQNPVAALISVKDTGPLTKKRMETCDDDFADRSVDFIKRQNAAGKPVFLWVNFTHMHFRTHTKPESIGQSGRWQSQYHDAMIDHDKNVGTVLKAIDDLGMADDTIVMYSTDNGPHMNSWPDAAMTPFRSEKNSNWEGAYRVPAMVRWPGHIKAGTVDNDIVSHLDWMPTLLAAAGVPDVKEQLLKGMKVGDTTFKVHLDGYNLLPLLTGQTTEESAQGVLLLRRRGRPELACATTTGSSSFPNSAPQGTMGIWAEPFTDTAVAQDLQSADGPLRTGRHHVEHLLRLGDRPCVCLRAGAGQSSASSSPRSRNSRRARRPAASASTRWWSKLQEGASGK